MKKLAHKTMTRVHGNKFCTVELDLEAQEQGPRFSITGTYGTRVTPAEADRLALQYWASYFEDDRDALQEMNTRCGRRFRSPTSAARYVLETDGRWHGLDASEDDNDGDPRTVYLTEGCGQVREEITEFFPELTWLFNHHLNDMNAGCEHQAPGGGGVVNPRPAAACQTCGYVYGSAWLYRKLPMEVFAVMGVEPTSGEVGALSLR